VPFPVHPVPAASRNMQSRRPHQTCPCNLQKRPKQPDLTRELSSSSSLHALCTARPSCVLELRESVAVPGTWRTSLSIACVLGALKTNTFYASCLTLYNFFGGAGVSVLYR